MLVGQIIEGRAVEDIVSCVPSTSVHDAVRLLATRRIGALPIVIEGRVAGIFSERDMLYLLAEEGEACLARAVGEVMTSPAITVSPQTPSVEALGLMTRRRIRHLPVVEGDRFIGFVSIGDLVKSRLDEVSQEADALRDYISMA